MKKIWSQEDSGRSNEITSKRKNKATTISQNERRQPMNRRLVTIFVTGIAAMAALVASVVSADDPELVSLIDQVDVLVEDVGVVQKFIDDGVIGFSGSFTDILDPTYRAGVADAELLKVTCGYYPQICAARSEDWSFRPSVGAVQNSIDDGMIGFGELHDDRSFADMLNPTYRAGVAGAELLKVTCGRYPQICAALNEDLSVRPSVGAVQNPIDDGPLGFSELHDDRTFADMLNPTYRAPVAGA